MAKNPMQKKAQNSFLLGMLITLLVTGIIIAFLVLQLTKIQQEQNEEQANLKTVYTIVQDVASGGSVTSDLLVATTVDSSIAPSNALTLAELDEASNTYDEDGNLISKVDVIAKIDIAKGTIVTSDMIATSDELASDLREQEYNVIVLPSQLETGDYIDIRLRLPDGTDYIVASHKKVTIPEVDGYPSLSTISLTVSETEILTLSCAIVECYQIEGSVLYATQYVDPGLQTAATVTYIPNNDVVTLIRQDPNCVTTAANEIITRYNDSDARAAVRDSINDAISNNADSALDDVISGTQEEVDTALEERQNYLESLGGSY